jgi:hypothetical protein
MITFCCAEEQLMELCAGWCASAPLGARSSSVWLHVDELGLLQVPNVDLVVRLEAILLELRRRLDDYAEGAVDEVVAADEGHNLAAQLQVTLADASKHAARVREQLQRQYGRQP